MTLAKWAAVFVSAWAAGLGFNAAALDTDVSWTKSVYLQKKQIAASLSGEPRLVFVGGSGVHYSVDAAEVERQLGIPSINFGLHAGLGLDPILTLALESVRPGDIVVLIPEYGVLADPEGSGWLSGMFGASIGRPGVGAFGAMDTAKQLFRAGVVNQMSLGKGVFVGVFGAQGRAKPVVDTRGDTAVFLDGSASPTAVEGHLSSSSRQRLDAFAVEVHARGAQLIVSLPTLLIAPGDGASVTAARDFAKALDRLGPVLSDNDLNLTTDRSLFSDTGYHLNEHARQMRSRELAHQIQAALSRVGAPTVAGAER